MKILKICIGITCLMLPFLSLSQSKLRNLQLYEIDTMSIRGNYLFVFRDTTRQYKLISSKQAVFQEGCWVKPVLQQRYLLNIKEVGEFKIGDLSIQLHDRGLYTDGPDSSEKEILAPGENLYISGDINGLFIKVNNR